MHANKCNTSQNKIEEHFNGASKENSTKIEGRIEVRRAYSNSEEKQKTLMLTRF